MNARMNSPARLALIVLASGMLVAAVGACSKQSGAGPATAPAQGAAGAQGGGGQYRGGNGQYQGGQGGRRQATVPVQATTVQVGLLSADRDTAGVVSPLTQSQVAAQVAGVVKNVAHLAGDWVQSGTLIVQLDDAQLKLSVANAQAALDNANINLSIGEDNANQANPKLALQVQSAQSALDSAQKNYDSQKALYALGGISASQLDSAASQLTAAQANLEGAKTALDQNQKSGDQTIAQLRLAVTQAENALQQAKLNLQYASIRAPFAGQIAAMNVQPGMYVGLNTPVFTLVSASRQIAFSVAPSDAPALPVGTKLTFEYGGKSYPIRVTQAPSAPINGVIPMVASALGPFNLPFGTIGNISYPVGVARGALVPIAALATLENQNYVFLVENGKAVIQNVSIIGEAGITAVVDGLAAGATVVVSPPPGLLQGTPVQVVVAQGAAQGAPGQSPGAAPGATPQATPAGARPGQPGARQGSAAPGQPGATGTWSGTRSSQGGSAQPGSSPGAQATTDTSVGKP
ncbi:MAG TPA: HlyD family efflux transporter periplasmic adaptor subunit [Rectinemataceae bacterium]|nr:HlyD family efflux transporter periplasmic adaptor subunit [Rectinemataceae bacterium]